MSWRIFLSSKAEKFLSKNQLTLDEVSALTAKAVRYLQGGKENVDIKRLHGSWKGFYRIRSGRVRIIVRFDFENLGVFIEEIDWRGNIY